MSADPTRLEIYCLDVGQGDCSVIVPPSGEGDPILFDCGDNYVAERFFANHGFNRLEAVVVSHLDIDHIRGILPFLKQHFAQGRQVGRLVLGLDRRDPGGAATDLIEAALEWGRNPPHSGFQLMPPFRMTSTAVRLSTGPDWHVELVLPLYDTAFGALHDGDESNLSSVVLRIERKGAAVLIGGDAPFGSWERLTNGQRTAHTIRTPHHGGDIREGGVEWTEFEHLYNTVKADRAIISVGTNNSYGHPLEAHIDAARRGTQCRVLCTQLTSQCHGKLHKVRDEALASASGLEFPYRHLAVTGHPSVRKTNEVPCAGTVLVSIDGAGTVFVRPKPKTHDELLDQLDQPMCRG